MLMKTQVRKKTSAEVGQSDQRENNAGDEEDILQHLLSGENPLSWI